MDYKTGVHLIACLHSQNTELLKHSDHFKALIDNIIKSSQLQKLGEIYHDFKPAGFTGVVCLSESHLSIHTWPEHGRINLDIYLSNYLRNNDGTVHHIFDAIKQHFNASVSEQQLIRR